MEKEQFENYNPDIRARIKFESDYINEYVGGTILMKRDSKTSEEDEFKIKYPDGNMPDIPKPIMSDIVIGLLNSKSKLVLFTNLAFRIESLSCDIQRDINEDDEFVPINSISFDLVLSIPEDRTKEEMEQFINTMLLDMYDKGYSRGNISDKWHTFDDLYYHRMILTLKIAEDHLDKVTRSWKHHDGTMFDDSFIVCFETPEGYYSYHYDSKDWDLFNKVKEVEFSPEYDGHKPEDVTRLLSL